MLSTSRVIISGIIFWVLNCFLVPASDARLIRRRLYYIVALHPTITIAWYFTKTHINITQESLETTLVRYSTRMIQALQQFSDEYHLWYHPKKWAKMMGQAVR
jgi:hypothetical protein